MTDTSPKDKKRAAFKRLAVSRTNAVLQKLRILGNCSNRQLYEYEEDEVRRIFRAIESEVKAVRAKFLNSGENEFEL